MLAAVCNHGCVCILTDKERIKYSLHIICWIICAVCVYLQPMYQLYRPRTDVGYKLASNDWCGQLHDFVCYLCGSSASDWLQDSPGTQVLSVVFVLSLFFFISSVCIYEVVLVSLSSRISINFSSNLKYIHFTFKANLQQSPPIWI